MRHPGCTVFNESLKTLADEKGFKNCYDWTKSYYDYAFDSNNKSLLDSQEFLDNFNILKNNLLKPKKKDLILHLKFLHRYICIGLVVFIEENDRMSQINFYNDEPVFLVVHIRQNYLIIFIPK